MHLLPDQLKPGLALVFCGTAPSRISAARKAYYANPGNQFWPALARTGITPHLFAPENFPQLLSLNIGLTDLCKTVSGNDDELPEGALDRNALHEKLLTYQPSLVAFTSKHGAGVYFGHKVEYGMQQEQLGKTRFFVLCSSSGRARRFWREELWQEVARLYQASRLGMTSR